MAQELVDMEAGTCCEITILWGTTVLEVAHLTGRRSYTIGEGETTRSPCDFTLPAQKLGMTRLPLVVADHGNVSVTLPPEAMGTVELHGQPKETISEARRLALPSPDMDGGHVLQLPFGARIRFTIGEFTFQVAISRGCKPMRHGIQRRDLTMLGYWGLSLGFVGALFGLMAFFAPPIGLTEDDEESQEQLFLVQQYLDSTAERERASIPPEHDMEAMENHEGGTGTRSKAEEGSRGLALVRRTNQSYSVKGNVIVQNASVARAASLREVRDFGMIGLLRSPALGDSSAATAPWGESISAGTDRVSSHGSLWGSDWGDARGASGFGLSGIGEGGGGRGEGIGLGSIALLGHGSGTGTGEGFGSGSGRLYGCGCGNGDGNGFGSGHGRLGGSHKTQAPKVRLGPSEIRGHLAFDAIQRVVVRNLGVARSCYERGLAKSPNLEGRVSVRFVIDRDGSVSNVRNGGSDLLDSDVVNCVLRSYYGLSFPEPKNGIVTVVYPLEFRRT